MVYQYDLVVTEGMTISISCIIVVYTLPGGHFNTPCPRVLNERALAALAVKPF